MPTYHHQFIHNVFADFIDTTLDFFISELYPRFEWSVVGTYSKAVEYINKQQQLGREHDKPLLPALILNPKNTDLSEASSGGYQFFRFPNFASGFLSRLFQPIYKDENLSLLPGFTRLSGELEFIALCNSYYEFFDLNLLVLQFFGGKERRIFPKWFNSYIIIPNELESYTFRNDVTNVSYSLDWDNNVGATDKLIDTIGHTKKVLPCRIKPMYYLTDISDGSERYGGSDTLADWRLNFTVNYEVELPSFIHIEELRDLEFSERGIVFNISYGSSYSKYLSPDAFYKDEEDSSQVGVIFPEFRESKMSFDPSDYIYTHVNTDSYVKTISPDSTSEISVSSKTLSSRYYLPITKEILDSTSEILLELPSKVYNHRYFEVGSKYGLLSYYDHYRISDDGNNLILRMQYINDLTTKDILEIFYFKGYEYEL